MIIPSNVIFIIRWISQWCFLHQIQRNPGIFISGTVIIWSNLWFQPSPLKNDGLRQIGSSSQLLGKITFMFQTTNQWLLSEYLMSIIWDLHQWLWIIFQHLILAVHEWIASWYPLVICYIAYIAIEHGHRNSGFTQLENGGSFHSKLLVYQRVMILLIIY